MDIRRYGIIFASIIALGAMPLVIFWQGMSGAISGLTAGLTAPFNPSIIAISVLLTAFALAQSSMRLQWIGAATLLLGLVMGVMVPLGAAIPGYGQALPVLIIGFALTLRCAYTWHTARLSIVALILSYAAGMIVARALPETAAPYYFLLGLVVITCLIMTAGACAGLILSDYRAPAFARVRDAVQHPVVTHWSMKLRDTSVGQRFMSFF